MKKYLVKEAGVNENGRIYSKEVLEKIVSEIKEKGAVGNLDFLDSPHVFSEYSLSHQIVNPELVDDKLYVEIVPMTQLHAGKVLKELIERDLVEFKPRGSGTVDDNFNVIDYEFLSIDAIIKEK